VEPGLSSRIWFPIRRRPSSLLIRNPRLIAQHQLAKRRARRQCPRRKSPLFSPVKVFLMRARLLACLLLLPLTGCETVRSAAGVFTNWARTNEEKGIQIGGDVVQLPGESRSGQPGLVGDRENAIYTDGSMPLDRPTIQPSPPPNQ
jgi:hypothetical protein